ncbi:unnamed protein product [Caenorhabditis auriculariae]|uniref:Uncharacterized protein n=1 Tax=Caenorhabditis auriculariae TaxID=2777116 RepID=A0A8S1HEM7_9PELO|nr:unnamed protein product [Caenorhabditis auriculariae]
MTTRRRSSRIANLSEEKPEDDFIAPETKQTRGKRSKKEATAQKDTNEHVNTPRPAPKRRGKAPAPIPEIDLDEDEDEEEVEESSPPKKSRLAKAKKEEEVQDFSQPKKTTLTRNRRQVSKIDEKNLQAEKRDPEDSEDDSPMEEVSPVKKSTRAKNGKGTTGNKKNVLKKEEKNQVFELKKKDHESEDDSPMEEEVLTKNGKGSLKKEEKLNVQPEKEDPDSEDDSLDEEVSPPKKVKLADEDKTNDNGKVSKKEEKSSVQVEKKSLPEVKKSDTSRPTTSSGRPRRAAAAKVSFGGKDYEEEDGIMMPLSSSSSSSEEDSEDEFDFEVEIEGKKKKDPDESDKKGLTETVRRKSNVQKKNFHPSSDSESESEDFDSDSGEEENEVSDEDVGNSRRRSSAPARKGFARSKNAGSRRPNNRKETNGKDPIWPKCSGANKKRQPTKTKSSGGGERSGGSRGLRVHSAAKPDQPWKKNLDNYQKERKMAKGERRMREFRIVSRSLAKGRIEEISYEECHKVLQELKKAYHEGQKLISVVEKEERRAEAEEKGEKESSSEDEWEEMEHFQPVANDQMVEVTMEKQEEEKDWWAIYLRQETNKAIRQNYENTHKAHILCYLAQLNSLTRFSLDESLVPSLLISQLPSGYLKYIGEPLPIDVAKKLVKWYTDAFRPLNGVISITAYEEQLPKGQEARYPATSRLTALVAAKAYETDVDRAVLLFCLLVGMECTARLCVNARVVPRVWNKAMIEELEKDMEVFRERSKTPPAKDSGETSTPSKEDKTGEESKKKKGKNSKAKPSPSKTVERNYWVEYWCTKQKRWICMDPLEGTVDEPLEMAKKASSPMTYVFAIDNKRGICEVAQRYALDCVKGDFRRRRTDPVWLTNTLRLPMFAANENRVKLEKMQMHEDLVKRPLPTTISEFKNHPLYVLEKDLLKFEAIYPPPSEQKPLGEIRGHKVYPRSTVFTCQGELNWVKLARSVKIGEKGYKTVKARPDPRVPVEDRVDRFMDVFGFWQTETYRRPVVKNGKIPRNEYGNVYMFQPKVMCPVGATYLKLPGLMRIASRLNKECVNCVVGWDFSGGATHPVIEGACVLDKDVELFKSEWNRLEAGRAAREEKKRIDRIYENWRKLIRGALRLNYVRKRFGADAKLEQAPEAEGAKGKTKKGQGKKKKDEAATKNESANESSSSSGNIVDNTAQARPMEGFSLDDLMKF